MRRCARTWVLAAAVLATAAAARAELQNTTVGGSIRIRANYYHNTYTPAPEVRWPDFFLPGRPIGGLFGNNVVSTFAWDHRANDFKNIEQRTHLNLKADFTDEVSAFIDLDSYDIWGTDFRSDYITGADSPANSVDDIEVYQAYIQADKMWGTPLRLRVGRQEMQFGNEWLVGNNDTAATFQGLSFDALRLTYDTDLFTVDAWASKLLERGSVEEDGDVDFYGVYGTYKGIQNVTLDAYWMLLRDARSLNDTQSDWRSEWIEDALHWDNYDPTYLNTVGVRGAGTLGAFDFNAEAAYQFGDADSIGFLFRPFTYGDDDAKFDNWGGNLELGYTFDVKYKPRVYVGGAYLGGEDHRGISFREWLSPVNEPKASVSFNRLFSDWEYSEFLENTDLSNAVIGRAGVGASPTDKVSLLLAVSYFQSLNAFEAPRYVTLGRFRVPIDTALSFWTQDNPTGLGTEVELTATYHYSEDLTFNAGWAHMFVDDGLEQGNFNAWNGLLFNGGTDENDADYVFLETQLSF